MSFTDFLRNHWDQGINRGMGAQRRRRNRLHPNAVQAPQAPVPPPPMGLNNEELLLHAEEHERAMMHEILANEHVQRAIIQQQQEAEAPGPLDLNNAPQEAFNMNNNDVNAADEAAILNAMNNEDEADMQLALDELIGLRGPWHIPFRNVMWLLLFNAIYIGIFAFVPYNIGHSAKAALYHYFHSYIQLLTPFIPLSWTSMLEDFFRLSRVSRNDLQLPTVLTIGTGFVVIAAIAFLAGSVLTHMHSTIPRIFINHYVAVLLLS